MSDFIQILNHGAANWMGLVWAVLWQSTLLAWLVAIVACGLRHSSPALRFWLWQILLIKLLLMPFWTVAIPLSFLRGAMTKETAGSDRSDFPAVSTDGSRMPAGEMAFANAPAAPSARTATWWRALGEISWQSWALMGWIAWIFWQIVRLIAQRVRLTRLLRHEAPAEPDVTRRIDEAVKQIQLRQKPTVVFTDFDGSPFVCGLRSPVLVLPRSLVGSLDNTQLRQVLMHELAHIKRHDLYWIWLTEIARIVYFWHPIVHWVSFRIRLERELACDQTAMSASGTTAAEYAETLVHVVSHSSQPSVIKNACSSVALDGADSSIARTTIMRNGPR